MATKTKAPKRGARTPAQRIFTREQGGEVRYWLDVRDLGAGRVPLRVPGDSRATTDAGLALALAEKRVAEAEQARREAAAFQVKAKILGLDGSHTFGAYCDHHLRKERERGRLSARWLDSLHRMFVRAVYFFDLHQPQAPDWRERGLPDGPRLLGSISTKDVDLFAAWVATQVGRRGTPLGPTSVLQHLSALSRLFRRALSEGAAQSNPVAGLIDRPTAPDSNTRAFHPREVAMILEAAKHYQAETTPGGCVHAVLCVLAFCGLRYGEVTNLLIQEVRATLPFGYIEVTADEERTVKTRFSTRSIPLSPFLVEVLEAHCRAQPRVSGFLFESAGGGKLGDLRKSFAAIARRCGMGPQDVRGRRFRATYATWRAACEGVTLLDLQHEMGHGDLSQLQSRYGKARKLLVSMPKFLDFSADRWLSAEDLAAARTPQASDRVRERERIVTAFLAAVAHLPVKQAARETGVDRNAIQRLRSGVASPANVKNATAEGMRRYLAGLDAPAAPLAVAA